MKLIEYKNKVYSVIIKNKGDNVIASIQVEGATATGKTEEDAYINLKNKLLEISSNSNSGKEKLIFG
jgi:hypothetical protein